ncbi:MAG: hypothetical protein FD130_183, partial [Halothiobacillaceae bacterium]
MKFASAPSSRHVLWLLFVVLSSGLSGVASAATPATNPEKDFWITDGNVTSVAHDGASVYLGGEFTYVGPNNGHGVTLNVSTGDPSAQDPYIDGTTVYAVIPDTEGGWYIGGNFTRVGGVARNNLAHIKADKSVDATFNPNPVGIVRALALSNDGSRLYVGGSFTKIATVDRAYIAELATATGALNATWAPTTTINGEVKALKLTSSSETLYVGGSFTAGFAALDAKYATGINATGAPLTTPAVTGTVNAIDIAHDDSAIYIGGSFGQVGSDLRNNVAKLNQASGAITVASWDPNVTGTVNAIAVNKPISTTATSYIYIGGTLTKVGSTDVGSTGHAYLARLQGSDGALDSGWVPGLNGEVTALFLDDRRTPPAQRLYVGGRFTQAGSTDRRYLAAFNLGSNADLVGWVAHCSGAVTALNISTNGSTLFAAG